MSTFAAIFDWDGVVIDSSAQHEKSWELLAAETGKSLPAGHFKKGFGKKNQVIIRNILGWSHDRDEIERPWRPQGGAVPRTGEAGRNDDPAGSKGVARRVESFRNSSSGRLLHFTRQSRLHFRVNRTGRILRCSRQRGRRCQRQARAGRLSEGRLTSRRAAQRCVVLEDALFGIEAAQRAGMKVVAVATTNPLDLLRPCRPGGREPRGGQRGRPASIGFSPLRRS